MIKVYGDQDLEHMAKVLPKLHLLKNIEIEVKIGP